MLQYTAQIYYKTKQKENQVGKNSETPTTIKYENRKNPRKTTGGLHKEIKCDVFKSSKKIYNVL